MRGLKTREVGEVFSCNNKKYEVIESTDLLPNDCDKCSFVNGQCFKNAYIHGACISCDRTDGKNVYFVEVNKNEN